jgi:hypothetical protein
MPSQITKIPCSPARCLAQAAASSHSAGFLDPKIAREDRWQWTPEQGAVELDAHYEAVGIQKDYDDAVIWPLLDAIREIEDRILESRPQRRRACPGRPGAGRRERELR